MPHSGDVSNWDQLPRTFHEAAALVRKLGFEYLWVDRLCGPGDRRSGDASHYTEKSAFDNAALIIVVATASQEGARCFNHDTNRFRDLNSTCEHCRFSRSPGRANPLLEVIRCSPKSSSLTRQRIAACRRIDRINSHPNWQKSYFKWRIKYRIDHKPTSRRLLFGEASWMETSNLSLVARRARYMLGILVQLDVDQRVRTMSRSPLEFC